MDFETYNGDIDLALPRTVSATTAISSGRGSFRTAFNFTPVKKQERPKSILDKVKKNVDEYQFGKINDGGIPLRIESENGVIQIQKTKIQSF